VVLTDVSVASNALGGRESTPGTGSEPVESCDAYGNDCEADGDESGSVPEKVVRLCFGDDDGDDEPQGDAPDGWSGSLTAAL
jgi:hypothetical protein